MHLLEDLVCDKHSGSVIGFVNLEDVNSHLVTFEHSLHSSDDHDGGVMAKSMLVIVTKGLFTSLRFPYAKFPCKSLTGNLYINEKKCECVCSRWTAKRLNGYLRSFAI